MAWPAPNYVDPVTRGNTLMIVELTILPVALLCVLLRLWIRIGWLRKAWWDDWLMLVAMVGCLAYRSCNVSLTVPDLLHWHNRPRHYGCVLRHGVFDVH
jgi:hypothetical protein